MNIDFEKDNGLVPAVIQDATTKKVLMLGYMNEEAYKATLEKKLVTFWSRSRSELWTKGETSGNFLELVDISVDCDNDTLLVQANPIGPVCHTGTDTCWGEENASTPLSNHTSTPLSNHTSTPLSNHTSASLSNHTSASLSNQAGEKLKVKSGDDFSFLSHLEDVIQDRRENLDDKSYVASLFKKGINKIAQKVGEEGVEVVIEAMDNNDDLFLNESADLIFHQLILLQAKGYKLKDVVEVLKGREK